MGELVRIRDWGSEVKIKVDGVPIRGTAKITNDFSYERAVQRGYVGTRAQFEAGVPSGATAYDLAVHGGFMGTEREWLDSLRRPPGDYRPRHHGTINRQRKAPNPVYLTPNELWLKAQQQLSADVAAELVRSRAELPYQRDYVDLGQKTLWVLFWVILIWLVVLASA